MTDSSSIRFGSVTAPSEAPSPGPRPAGSWPRRVPRIEQRWARWRSSLGTHALRHRDRSRSLPPRGARASSHPAPEQSLAPRCRCLSTAERVSTWAPRTRPDWTRSEPRQPRGARRPWASSAHRSAAASSFGDPPTPPRFDTRSCILPRSIWTLVSQSRAVVTS
jgi:hypothetical protein